MAEDLMNTQTGGTGETIQLQPEVKTTPEQFDVKINPPVDSEPVQAITPESKTEINTPIEPATPVMEEEPVIEEEPIGPPVTREGMAEVSLSDDADTQSAFTEAGIMPDMSMAPKSIEQSSELDLSGYTIDGAEQASNIIPVEAEEVQQAPMIESIDLSKYTIDGVQQAVNPEVKKEEKAIKQEYANTPVKIDESGNVRIEKPKAPIKEEDGELYTYKARPGVVYKKKGPNDWYIDTKGNGNFVKIEKNAKSRIAELEKNAIKVSNQKTQKQKEADKILQSKFGEIKDFNGTELLTSGGDPTITKGLSFNELTKSNEPSKSDKYTNNGQINFNYDPNYAASNKETRAILDAQEKGKGDGLYKYPGSNAVYQKQGNTWLKDSSGTGKNFKPLSKGDVAERIKALESKAIPVNEYTLSFNLKNQIANNPFLKKDGKKINPFEIIKEVTKPIFTNEIQEAKDKYTFDEAKNFADKDLINMFAKNNTFSGKQLNDMLEMQKQAKKIVGDGNYDPIKAKAAEGLLGDLNEYYNQAKAINEKINSAYSRDMSLDRYNLEEKRKDYNDLLNVASSTSDMQDAAKATFESTLNIADFIQDAVDDGKMLYDRKNGGYKYSTNLTETERNYYEKKLGSLLSDYKKIQGTRFESINNELSDLKSIMRDNLVKISSVKEKMSKLNTNSEEYKNLSKELWSLTSENKKIDKDIANKQSLKSTVFLTEPKKLVAQMKPTESATAIFNAIPEQISPKQKFDLFYKQLIDKNNRLAKENNIDGTSLSGKLSQYGRELLDWGGYFSLSDKEKEWLNNRAMLNQLSPLYFNNDYGFTEGAGGFYDSFINSFGQLLAPKASRAQGYFNQSEAANTIMNTLSEQGFSKDDIVDTNYSKALKDKANVDFWSREQFGGMIGTTAGIIVPLIVTKKIPMTALKVAGRLENLVTKTKNAENLALYLTRAENVFDNTLKATKYGKYLVNPIKTGLEFEATGRVFGSTRDEMYFLSGFTGGLASEAFAGLISKMPANKVYGYMSSMFGGKTERAVNIIKKIGEANVRGLTETAEEFGNELSNIYTDQLREKGFFEELSQRFGTLDKVQEFVISTYIMGAGFGIVDSDKKRAAYDSLSPEKKAQVDEVLNTVREDMQSAEDNVDKYVDEQTEEIDRKQKFEKEPQKEVKTNDTGDIEFDVNNIEETSQGRPSVVAESKAKPSSFTEPIDLTKLEENAEENKPGIPSEERIGEKPIEAKPIVEPSKEEAGVNRMVQEEQGPSAEVKPTPRVVNVLGKNLNSYTDYIPNKEDVEPEALYTFTGDSKEEIPELLRDKAYANTSEVNGIKTEKWYASISGDDLAKIYEERQVGAKTPSNQVKTFGDRIINGKEIKSDADKKFYEANKKAIDTYVEENKPTKVEEAAPVTTTMFTEASDISKIKKRADRQAAEKAFEEKHGIPHKKVSNINTNFASIVKNLQNNNLIEKEC